MYWLKIALMRNILTARMLSSRIIMFSIWWLQDFHRMLKTLILDRSPKQSMLSRLQSKVIQLRMFALELAEWKWGWVREKTWNKSRPTSWGQGFKFTMSIRTKISSQFSAPSKASWIEALSVLILMPSFRRFRTCRLPSQKLSGIIAHNSWEVLMILLNKASRRRLLWLKSLLSKHGTESVLAKRPMFQQRKSECFKFYDLYLFN